MKKLTGRQNTEPFNILAQFTQMNQAEFKLLSMVLLFAHAQNTTPILILTFTIFERQDLMSKFSHSSSGTLNNNFVRAAHFVGQRRETISIVNDNEFLNFF